MTIRVILSMCLLFITIANVFAAEQDNASGSIGCDASKISSLPTSSDYRKLVFGDFFKPEKDGTLSIISGILENFSLAIQAQMIRELDKTNQAILEGRETPYTENDERLFHVALASTTKKRLASATSPNKSAAAPQLIGQPNLCKKGQCNPLYIYPACSCCAETRLIFWCKKWKACKAPGCK